MAHLRAIVFAVAAITGAAHAHAQDLALTRVRVDSSGTLTALAVAGYEIAGLERIGGVEYAIIVTTARQRGSLVGQGHDASAAPSAPAQGPPVHFRDFNQVSSTLDSLAAANPLVTLDTLGLSWEGRPILSVKVGPSSDALDRPNVLYIGVHHAREWIAAEVPLRLLGYLSDSLPLTIAGQRLLAERDVWLIPVLNPDGYQYSFDQERLWRKNRGPNDDGSVGVDLNRNYPRFWGLDDVGSSGASAAETYRGPSPASELETAALIQFHQQHPPAVAISFHSYSDLILYPYGHRSGRIAPDQTVFRALAGTPVQPALLDRLPETARGSYFPGPAWALYPINGEYAEWAYHAHGTAAFTVELTAGCCVGGLGYYFEFPDDSAAIAQVFDDNLPFALAAMEAAGEVDLGSGPSGLTAETTLFESLWPELRLVSPPASVTLPVTLSRAGEQEMIAVVADSLDQGRFRWRWRAPSGGAGAATVFEVPGLGQRVQLMYVAGAEDSTEEWEGWVRDSSSTIEGRFLWFGVDDTLVSASIELAGVRDPRIAFWTRHAGSLFQPQRQGTVELSQDDGASWSRLALIEGAAPEWYPVSLPIPETPGSVRLRFISRQMPWAVDAFHLFGVAPAMQAQVTSGTLGVSENPVRSDRVFFSWAGEAGEATFSVFTFVGDLVYQETIPAPRGQIEWDLGNRVGAVVDNGAYMVVLQLPSGVLRRRLFLARGP